jgi:CDP-diacylglycerol---glycerol-3-phosphate 3-phosphatidyltransferase
MRTGIPTFFAVAALLSLAFYAWRRPAPDRDATRKDAHLLAGVADFLVHWLFWLMGPMERALLAGRVSPATINYVGFALGALCGLAFACGWLVTAALALGASGICDTLDGRIARASDRTSRRGAFLDSTLDRFVEVFVLLGLLIHLGAERHGPLLVLLALAGSLLVSYTRARGEAYGIVCNRGLMQRAERLVVLIAAALASSGWFRASGVNSRWPLMGATALIASGTLATAVYRVFWIAKRLPPPRAD